MSTLKDANLGSFVYNGIEYRYEVLPPVQALAYGARVTKVVGGALGAIADAMTNKKSLNLSTVFASTDPLELADLVKESLVKCSVQDSGRWREFSDEAFLNAYFQEHSEDLYMVGLSALWYQAKPFFPRGLRTRLEGLAQQAKEQAKDL